MLFWVGLLYIHSLDELLIAGELQESSKRAVLNTLKRIDDVNLLLILTLVDRETGSHGCMKSLRKYTLFFNIKAMT